MTTDDHRRSTPAELYRSFVLMRVRQLSRSNPRQDRLGLLERVYPVSSWAVGVFYSNAGPVLPFCMATDGGCGSIMAKSLTGDSNSCRCVRIAQTVDAEPLIDSSGLHSGLESLKCTRVETMSTARTVLRTPEWNRKCRGGDQPAKPCFTSSVVRRQGPADPGQSWSAGLVPTTTSPCGRARARTWRRRRGGRPRPP